MKPLSLEELEQDGWEADADFKNKIADREAQIELNNAAISIAESVGKIAENPGMIDMDPMIKVHLFNVIIELGQYQCPLVIL